MVNIIVTLIIIYFVAGWLDRYFLKPELGQWRSSLSKLTNMLEENCSRKELTTRFNELVCELFDFVYDKDHYSEKRLKRSIISSLVGMVIFTVLIGINPIGEELNSLFFTGVQFTGHTAVITIIAVISPLFFNILPDYFSLLETRLILGFAKGKPSWVLFLLVLVDIVLTSLIFMVGFYVFMVFGHVATNSEPAFQKVVNPDNISLLSLESLTGFISLKIGKVFLLTTFLTSFFWILFISAYAGIYLLYRSTRITKYFFKQLEQSKSPVTVLATGLNIVILAFYAVVTLIN